MAAPYSVRRTFDSTAPPGGLRRPSLGVVVHGAKGCSGRIRVKRANWVGPLAQGSRFFSGPEGFWGSTDGAFSPPRLEDRGELLVGLEEAADEGVAQLRADPFQVRGEPAHLVM